MLYVSVSRYDCLSVSDGLYTSNIYFVSLLAWVPCVSSICGSVDLSLFCTCF